MRVGSNPNNFKKVSENKAFHRVIIPVHIPHETDYFKHAFEIFRLGVLSLKKTSSSYLKISIISNDSSHEINQKLLQFSEEHDIDELIIEREGIGKINSIFKAIQTSDERLITVTDADVLFDNGWEDAVLDIFKAFPNAGAVCPVPVFRKQFHLTSNIWLRYLCSSKLKFTSVLNPDAMTQFAKSIGWQWLDDKYKDVILTLEAKHALRAVVGCSHFVATYKREVFNKAPKEKSTDKIRGQGEYLYMDLPVLKQGGYRLSTEQNYAFHMGNVLEDWMINKFETLSQTSKKEVFFDLKYIKPSILSNLFLEKGFQKIISKPYLKKRLLKIKGLSDKKTRHFL